MSVLLPSRSPGAPAAPTTAPDTTAPRGAFRGDHHWHLVAGGMAVVAVPLLVALAAVRSPQWFPVLDRAKLELQMRDVGGAHSPLIGAVARMNGYGQQGNHPGPLSFYLMWPVYRAFGGTAWALQAAVAGLQMAAVGTVLWLGARRGGRRLVIGLLVAVALVARGVGPGTLVDPWNPYLSLLWWMAFVLAVWSLVEGDLPALPVAVVAGSICAQNHVEYVPLVAGLGGLAVLGLALLSRRGRWRPVPRLAIRPLIGWTAGAGTVAALVWAPPALDELRRSPGNLAIIVDQFRHGSEPAVGLSRGVRALLVHADPIHLVRGSVIGDYHVTGSLVPGAALLAAGAASAALSWKLRHGPLVRLHAVLLAAFLLGAVAMSRISGDVWFWLGLWAAVLAALTLTAIGWTAAVALDVVVHPHHRWSVPVRRWALAVAGAVLLVAVTADARLAQPSGEELSAKLAAVAPPTIAGLRASHPAGRGPGEPRYLVTFTDPINLGMHAFGLVNELERAGYRAGMTEEHRASVGAHRVIRPGEATAVIHLAVGPDIERWRQRAGARQLAYVDDRSRAERAEYGRLHDELVDALRGAGRTELAAQVDTAVLAIGIAHDLPPGAKAKAERMMEIGLPTAVFLAPADTPASPR